MGDKHIHLDDISLTFRVHSARTYSIKETIVNYIASQNTGATGDATVGGGFGNATCSVPPMP